MINIENLNLKFEENIIFQNANIFIPDNKLTMIIGANGTGKTTLLKIITNQLKTQCNITNTFKKTFYLPQKLIYPQNITTFDYLSSVFFKNNWNWFLDNQTKDKIEKVLDCLELSNKKNINIENLSAGEMQKVNIALGLLSDADLFLLDEPTSNMDLVNQIKILDMIKNLLKSNITSIIIMHDLNLSSSYGDYFIGLGQNYNVIQGYKKEFFKEEILNDIYNIKFKVVNNEEKFYVQIFS